MNKWLDNGYLHQDKSWVSTFQWKWSFEIFCKVQIFTNNERMFNVQVILWNFFEIVSLIGSQVTTAGKLNFAIWHFSHKKCYIHNMVHQMNELFQSYTLDSWNVVLCLLWYFSERLVSVDSQKMFWNLTLSWHLEKMNAIFFIVFRILQITRQFRFSVKLSQMEIQNPGW